MSEVLRAVCPHDCPDTCSMLVTVEAGRATKVAGDPAHPFTQGFLCTKVSRYVERTYHEERLQHPLIRVGPKGGSEFRRATWDEALTVVAQRLKAIISLHGPQAILPYSYGGTLGVVQGGAMPNRFFHHIGASLLDRTICASAGMEAMNLTYGCRMGTDPESVGEAKLVLLWGTNTLTSNPHLWPFIKEAQKRGGRIICIDPLRTRTADACDEHIPIRPGTDAALALGMMHVMFRDGLADESYLEAMTLGWRELRDRVLANYEPSRVARICRLDEADIVRLAKLYGSARPSFIRLNYGLQRHAGGGNAVRAISLLPAVSGTWDDVGGGCQLSSSSTFRFNSAAADRPDLVPPGTRTINMSALGEALHEAEPPIRALVVYNSNPASIAPDTERVRAGLARKDLFVVVLEHFLTDTCDFADVVLPATTQLEHEDLHKGYGHLYVMLNRPTIDRVGEALPNSEIFRRLAAAMGIDAQHLRDSDETIIRQALDVDDPVMEGITYERLRDEGPQRLRVPRPHLPFPRGMKLPTPTGKIEIVSTKLATAGLDPLPDYIPPHESEERDPAMAARFPLALISPPAHTFLNSTFVNVKSLRRVAAEPFLDLNPADALERDISDGALVRIYNDRGSFVAKAIVTTRVQPGIVATPSVWWSKLTPHASAVNATTSQKLTDLGGGATFYDNLVEVALEK